MSIIKKDVILKDDAPKELILEKHAAFIASYGQNKNDYEYAMTDYLRMSGIYWGLTALELIGESNRLNLEEIVEFICKCQDPISGGFSASIGHDPHMLYTLSAVQILTILNKIDVVNVNKIVKFVTSLQQSDGSFVGDKWGEVDTRFSFCAVTCLSLLNKLDAIDLNKSIEFIKSCMNFDGGFGSRPKSESHAGLIYCCVGFLSVVGHLHIVDADTLGWWLCERQLDSGGLNGRPEKLPDVCYSWWVLASLSMLGRLHWINAEALERFILASQDTETGGFSDRPEDIPDPFHTLFGIAALSLLGNSKIKPVDPTYCMPKSVIDRLHLKPQKLSV